MNRLQTSMWPAVRFSIRDEFVAYQSAVGLSGNGLRIVPQGEHPVWINDGKSYNKS